MVMQANLSMALPPDYIRDRGVVGPTAPGNIAVKPAPPTKNAPGGLGSTVYRGRGGRGQGSGIYQNYGSTANLPTVSDPDKTFAQITRNEYLDYVNNYRDFEEQLIEQAQNDTSLIDQAREDVSVAQGIAKGVSDRNRQRYGASLTPAQLQQRDARLQRANTLGGIQSVNDARLAQREANTRLLGDLINIGQGVNRSSLDQMGSAAADATQRKNAYQAAKAQSKAQTYSTIGSLGAMAIMAFAF